MPGPLSSVLDAIPVLEQSRLEKRNSNIGKSDSDPLGLGNEESEVEPVVTRKERWSYYLWINGNNGTGPSLYSLIIFQALVTAAGYDPVAGVGSSCTAAGASGQCRIPWGSGTKAISSVVLIANSICFAVMAVIFTTLNAAADYGSLGQWLLLGLTCICWAAQFASMSLTSPSRWPAAMSLYIVSFISEFSALIFYAAVFPRLARNTPHARQLRNKYLSGQISQVEYEIEESLEKNRISNISTVHYTIGYTAVSCINLSLLLPLASNPLVNNYTLVLTTGYSVVIGTWWFVFRQPRPGQSLPPGEHYLTIGWKQIWEFVKEFKKLPYTFIFIFAYFLLSDGFNTTSTLVFIIQNEEVSFSFLESTFLGLAQSIPSTIGTLGLWHIQRYWKFSTKRMFMVTVIMTVIIPLWGMVGIWTRKIGFHHRWEFWAYNVIYGLSQTPYFAFSQTMMAELTPPGFEYMVFGFFGLTGRAASMIGPNVVQAIINKSGNNSDGFPFLFALCLVGSIIILLWVDIPNGRRDAVAWAEKRLAGSRDGGVSAEKI